MTNYYDRICEIQEIAWRDDDRIDQENLFELQDKIADLALLIASAERKTEELMAEFPWIYRKV